MHALHHNLATALLLDSVLKRAHPRSYPGGYGGDGRDASRSENEVNTECTTRVQYTCIHVYVSRSSALILPLVNSTALFLSHTQAYRNERILKV